LIDFRNTHQINQGKSTSFVLTSDIVLSFATL
jgi:hypothetical protein